jgi:hypothetical protein
MVHIFAIAQFESWPVSLASNASAGMTASRLSLVRTTICLARALFCVRKSICARVLHKIPFVSLPQALPVLNAIHLRVTTVYHRQSQAMTSRRTPSLRSKAVGVVAHAIGLFEQNIFGIGSQQQFVFISLVAR